MMIAKCNIIGKPVVTATQMLESMIGAPRPTRAECADVANAVLDGSDCVMLSGETANGEYPQDAVAMMCNTCMEAESLIPYDKFYDDIRYAVLAKGPMTPTESIASSAVKTSRDTKARAIIVLSETGRSARDVAKYRPHIPVLVLTASPSTARQVQGYMKGCKAVLVESLSMTDDLLAHGVELLKEYGWCVAGDEVVCIAGSTTGSGSTNMLSLRTVV
jgi:pyruvate kinase